MYLSLAACSSVICLCFLYYSFARSYQDEFDLLYPLYKCCKIRRSSLNNLLQVYRSPTRLTEAMRISLQREPVQPLLSEAHLHALDRRLVKVLEVIYGCIGKDGKGARSVIVDD